ncbi:MAG: HD domain-containing phosphohydrolase [Steroidobacteraceae bacterium]
MRGLYPDSIRVLLTGEPGRDAVVSAVNQGQIFRFLTKPCRAEDLLTCIEAAVDQYRLVTAERVLLQHTIIGCIRALIDVLSLPAELVEKINYGETLTPEERVLAEGVPEVAGKLLGHIPRLEPALQVLSALTYSSERLARLGEGTIGTAARILLLVIDFDVLTSRGQSPEASAQLLQQRPERYGAKLAKDFATHLGMQSAAGS